MWEWTRDAQGSNMFKPWRGALDFSRAEESVRLVDWRQLGRLVAAA